MSDPEAMMSALGGIDTSEKITNMPMPELGMASDAMLAQVANNIKSIDGKTDPEDAKRWGKKQTVALASRLSTMLGQTFGSLILKSQGKEAGAATNAIGAASSIGSSLLMDSNPYAAIGLSIAGPILGALVGSDIEEEEQTKQLSQIQKNTASLVDRLDQSILNSPANFTLPASGAFLGGGGVTITNHISITGSGLDQSTATDLATQLDDLYNRSATGNSILQ